jgi:hypothetical protein
MNVTERFKAADECLNRALWEFQNLKREATEASAGNTAREASILVTDLEKLVALSRYYGPSKEAMEGGQP